MKDEVRIRRKPSNDRRILVRIRQWRQRLRRRLRLRGQRLGGHSLEAAQLDSISYLLNEEGALESDWQYLPIARKARLGVEVEVPFHEGTGYRKSTLS